MTFHTPILILCWRRPHTLRQVINAIRPVAPTCIFVACDGPNPNRPGEAEKVAATRDLIEQDIDWPCQIERFYSDYNQGCRWGVSRAINWFFEHVEEGIILEDDCVPHPDFFSYCELLLDRYRHDTRVWCISGNNFQDGLWHGCGDYLFSQIPMCWGWATWRTRWQCYDSHLDKWPVANQLNLLVSLIPNPAMRKYWSRIWHRLWVEGVPDSWAYRWAFTCVINSLTAIPKVNLVSNVGFGDDATHTVLASPIRKAEALGNIGMTHPIFVASHIFDDNSIFDNHFGGKYCKFPFSLLKVLRTIARRLIRVLQLKAFSS